VLRRLARDFPDESDAFHSEGIVLNLANNEKTLLLSFVGSTADEGNYYATGLRDFLIDLEPGLVVEKRRERADTQDFGSTLVLVLGTAAASALARGVAAWLSRNAGARITLKKATGELVAEGLDSRDAAKIVQALSGVL